MRAVAVAVVLAGVAGCGGPKPVAPRPELPPLSTSSLGAIAQGPGARWAIVGSPKALFTGPFGPRVDKIVPKQGLDKLQTRLGFDLRATPRALMVGYAATTFYAARLPDGTAPSSALDAFDKRLLAPKGKATPRPDLVRIWGSMPSGVRGSAAGMWSSLGDAIVGEGGRLGPVLASMALATGKLAPERAITADKTFGPLLAWAEQAEVGAVVRCPLADSLDAPAKAPEGKNVLLQECFGVGVTLRPKDGGKLAIAVRVTGAWGGDAAAAAEAMRATFASVAESDLGRVLGLRDAQPTVKATAAAVDGELLVDADAFATGLRRVLAAEIDDTTK